MAKKDNKSHAQGKDSGTSEISKKFKQSPGLYIGSVVILVLVVVTFLGGDLLQGRTSGPGGDWTFGHYNNVPISFVPGNMFHQYHDQVENWFRGQGHSLDSHFIQAQIWRQAFEMAAVHTAILNIMNRSNYAVPERTVNRIFTQLPHFQHNGLFSPALHNQMPAQRRNELWRQVQDELTRGMFFSDLFDMLIPEGEAAFIANMASTMRTFEIVSFNVENFPESEFISFAQENEELFSSIHLSRITANTEREARRILESIQDGAFFEEIAISQSTDFLADRGGDMGSRLFLDLDWDIPNLEDRQNIFALAAGELSDVVNTGHGWAFFRVEAEAAPADLDDEFTMDRVRSFVRGFRRGLMEDWAIAQAEEFIEEVNEAGFETVTRWRFMERQTVGPLPMNFGNIPLFTRLDTMVIPGLTPTDVLNLSNNENFWRIAFSTELNTPSAPLVQGSNVLVFFPVEETQADEFHLENIAANYSSFWLNNITEQSLQPYFLNHPNMRDIFWDVWQ